MIKPDHKPNKVQYQASIGSLSTAAKPYNLSGKVNQPAKYKAGVAKIVEINNQYFNTSDTPLKNSVLKKQANKKVIKETMIPKAEIIKGQNKAEG